MKSWYGAKLASKLALCGHIRAKLRALTLNASLGVIASYALENASKPRLPAALIDIDTFNRSPDFSSRYNFSAQY